MAAPTFCQQGTLHAFAKGTGISLKSPARHVDRSRVDHAARLRLGSGAFLRCKMSPLSLQHSSNRRGARAWSPSMRTCKQLLNLSRVPLAAVRQLALRQSRLDQPLSAALSPHIACRLQASLRRTTCLVSAAAAAGWHPALQATPVEDPDAWREELRSLAAALHSRDAPCGPPGASAPQEQDPHSVVRGPERAFIVGVQMKGKQDRYGYSIQDSLDELERLADSAGLEVVGRTYQMLDVVSPRTYIGSGKVEEIVGAVAELKADTLIFDDELTPGQLRNLEKAVGNKVRLCDRTALILDIFSQRAATREGMLQVELARTEYQLPRLTRMWQHLERQAGGRVKGMGEKQIEVDRRLLRDRRDQLKKAIEDVRAHRRQYRKRRQEMQKPVVALVGYTNAGKSTLLNCLTEAGVVAEDKLFATLDPTTRRVNMPSGRDVLVTDTVGFIQKLPTQLVAAFRATLEEIKDAALLVHVVDVSHPNAAAQTQAVMQVLDELKASQLPTITLWNKVDACKDPDMVRAVAAGRKDTLCISARTGEGVDGFVTRVEECLEKMMVPVQVLVPFAQFELCGQIHRTGAVDIEQYVESGVFIKGRVPVPLAQQLKPLTVSAVKQHTLV